MKGRTLAIIAGLALISAGTAILWPSSRSAVGQEAPEGPPETPSAPVPPARPVQRVEIPPQATFSVLMEEAGLPGSDAAAIYAASRDVYDLATIRAGKSIDLVRDVEGGPVVELVYMLNDEDELHVRLKDGAWIAAKETIAYEIRLRTVEGTVESSLNPAALAQGID